MDLSLGISLILAVVLVAAVVALRRRGGDLRIARSQAGELSTQLAVERTRVEERDGQLVRLRAERDGAGEETRDVVGQLEGVRQTVTDLAKVVDGTRQDAARAAAGANRIDHQLLNFTRRLANPQSRGAFGEEALRNQLEHLGLVEDRDYRRQVKESGGKRRIDYCVYLRDLTVGIDPKFALDPDLQSLGDALAEGDQAQLQGYAKKLIDRAKELARKEYWASLERSPTFVLMFVPIEGAHEALAAMPKFSYEKFAIEHRIYIITPLQLATVLGVIAEIAHAAKRSEETEELHQGLLSLDQELAKFCEHYAKHGRQLAATVSSYNAGGAILSSRGGLGRMVKQIRGYSRRLSKQPDQPSFESVRDDIDEISRGYAGAVTESKVELRRSA